MVLYLGLLFSSLLTVRAAQQFAKEFERVGKHYERGPRTAKVLPQETTWDLLTLLSSSSWLIVFRQHSGNTNIADAPLAVAVKILFFLVEEMPLYARHRGCA